MAEIQIETTQNVTLSFKAAEVEKRVLAFIVDIFIILSFIFIMNFIYETFFSSFFRKNYADFWSKNALSIIISSPAIFYTLVLESIFEGQTLGKKLLKIKVVKIDGFKTSFIDFLMRWFFRVIDIYFIIALPGLIAFISSLNSKNHQRLGGLASGTAVIDMRSRTQLDKTIFQEIEEFYKPKYSQVLQLSDNDIRIIKENLVGALTRNDHNKLNLIKEKILKVTGIRIEEEVSSKVFIERIIKDYNFYASKN